MTSDAILSVCSPSASWMSMPPLQKSMYESSNLSNSMEIELRQMVSEYRENEGLTTVFDDQCCYTLSMALSAYETERITGLSANHSYCFTIHSTCDRCDNPPRPSLW